MSQGSRPYSYAPPLISLHPSPLTRTRCASLLLTIALPSAGYLRRRVCLQPTPRGVECLSDTHGLAIPFALCVRAASRPLSRITATASHRHALLTLSLFLSDRLLASHLSHALLLPTV